MANNVNYRYDVRELFTTLLKYCSDVSAQYIEDLCHAFADLGLPTTGLTHWILITDVIVLSCSLDEDTTSNDALQNILDCKQGDRELQIYVAEFEGLVRKFHRISNIAQVQPELSMMMLRSGMNQKVKKQVMQRFESQHGSAGQNMTWTPCMDQRPSHFHCTQG